MRPSQVDISEACARHYCGWLLIGAGDCPNSVPDEITDERLRRVVEAVIGVRYVDHAWPVDMRRVADTLAQLGVLEEIGGETFLIDLVETWSEREDRARRLAVLLLVVQAIEALESDVARAEQATYRAIDRLETARQRASAAYRHLPAATESHVHQ